MSHFEPPETPVFTGELSEKPQPATSIELRAQELLSLDRFSVEDVFPLLQHLPSEHQRFSGEFSWASGAYVHGGIVGLRHNLVQYPLVSRVFSRLITSIFPDLEFTSFVVLLNTQTPAHQDLNNQSGFLNALIPLNKFEDGGLWLEGPGHEPCPDPAFPQATGTIVPLQEPVLFDAHQRHATCPWRGTRCVLAAFVMNDFHKLSPESEALLRQAEFNLPALSTGEVEPLPRTIQARFPVVLEFFAGTARVTAALRRLGFEGSQGVDHLQVSGAACPVLISDLTTASGQGLALQWLSSPHVIGIFLAPPCGTCSRAREIPLDNLSPSPLRSSKYPNGLPHLSGQNLVRVNRANQLYKFLGVLCQQAQDRNLLVAVENPRNSLFWSTSFWADTAFVCPSHVDFQHCAYGSRRPKWTRIHHNHPNFSTLHRLCPGPACAKHHLPWGRDPVTGDFATAQETAYPPALADAIANCFVRAVQRLPEAEPTVSAVRAVSGPQPKAHAFPPLVPEHKAVHVLRGPANVAHLPPLRARLAAPWHDPRFLPSRVIPKDSQLLRADNRGDDQLELAWGEAWSPDEFMQKAIEAGHPKTFDTILPSALEHSIAFNAESSPAEVASLRAAWFAKWTNKATELSAEENEVKKSLPDYARNIVLPKRILLWREILKDLEYPDMDVVDEMLGGVKLTDQTPCTNVFPAAFKPAKHTVSDLEANAMSAQRRILESIKSQGHLDKPLEEKVDEEVGLGWLSEPVDPADVPCNASISRRFAIEQGDKIRLIDDLSDSGVNGSVQTTESPKPQSLDIVAAMVLECLRKLNKSQVIGKTYDLKSAYRQMFISPSSLDKAYIAYFSEREGRVVIRKMLALPFGATRAVFSYLRVAHSIWYIGCKALKLIWSHFFDDFICLSAEQESKSVDLAVMTLFRLLGWKVSESKDKPFSTEFGALGVLINFERFLEGEVFFNNTEKRVKEVSSSLRKAVDDTSLTQKDLSRLRGRMLFAGGQLFGRAGRLCISALKSDDQKTSADLDEAAKAAMLQFADLLEAKLPRVVKTCTLEPYYIFTDASYSPDGEGSYCGIGGVCLDNRGVPLGFFSAELSGAQKALLGEGLSKTIIFEAELATVIIAFVLWRSWLKGRPIVFYIDNNSARDVAISGVSRNRVGKSLAALLLTVETMSQAYTWFARTPSPANVADEPSRAVLQSMEIRGESVACFSCKNTIEDVLSIFKN